VSVEERVARLEQAIANINAELGEIKGKLDEERVLIKWVIFPLLMVVAALVGIKLIAPGG
jgi:hypothetical protein